MSASLYERLRGAGRIAAIVDDFVDLHLANRIIKARFSRMDAGQIESAMRYATEFSAPAAAARKRTPARDLLKNIQVSQPWEAREKEGEKA